MKNADVRDDKVRDDNGGSARFPSTSLGLGCLRLPLRWIELAGKSARPTRSTSKQQSRPTVPCDGPRMNPSVDVGCPPRPFRHLRMAERRTPDLSSSRAPVHSALVQKSVTAITNPAGRLSIWMLGKSHALGKWKTANSWQVVCNQSNKRAALSFRLSALGFQL
jgi:hypothetical protein